MPPKYKFAENEKVLCYHGPLLYEAKVCVFSDPPCAQTQGYSAMVIQYGVH